MSTGDTSQACSFVPACHFLPQSALPEWLALTSAHVRAGHRSDLSRLRALAGSQLAALRKDLKELKDTCRASLGEMAAYATQTMEKVRMHMTLVVRV